jgi:small Trp-rich protein
MLWLGVVLLVLKLLDVAVVGAVSWWWIGLPFLGAFIWFEVFERRLGWDKKKAFDEIDKAKALRIKRSLERDKTVFRDR